MAFRVVHTTTYSYAEKVGFTDHKFYLRPREDHHTRVRSCRLSIMPGARIRWTRDAYENVVGIASITDESRQLVVRNELEVDMLMDNPFDFLLENHAINFPFSYSPAEQNALRPYLATFSGETLTWLHEKLGPTPSGDTIGLLTRLNQAVYDGITYTRRDDPGVQTAAETLRKKSGSCRDFTMLFMEACRHLGLAARFTSGYLFVPQNMKENRAENSMHAWAEVYLPGAGWKGFDPTNGILSDKTHIPVAVAAEPESINPIQGSYCKDHPVENSMSARVEIINL